MFLAVIFESVIIKGNILHGVAKAFKDIQYGGHTEHIEHHLKYTSGCTVL